MIARRNANTPLRVYRNERLKQWQERLQTYHLVEQCAAEDAYRLEALRSAA